MGVTTFHKKGYGVFINTMLRPLLFTPWNHTEPFDREAPIAEIRYERASTKPAG
jgi:hypothetical protein